MTRKSWFAHVFVLIVLFAAVGCGASPTPRPQPTPPPQIITVVVTATQPPATPTSSEPTVTPMATAAVTATAPVNTPVAAIRTPAPTSRPPATKKPTATIVRPPTPVPLVVKFKTPKLISPIFNDVNKDTRNWAQTIVFEWQSIGMLPPGVCYMVRVDFNPGQGDAFLQCGSEATQVAEAQTSKFSLYPPGKARGPNYIALLPNPPVNLTVSWWIQVVGDNGPGNDAMGMDGVRHGVSLFSYRSETATFPLTGS